MSRTGEWRHWVLKPDCQNTEAYFAFWLFLPPVKLVVFSIFENEFWMDLPVGRQKTGCHFHENSEAYTSREFLLILKCHQFHCSKLGSISCAYTKLFVTF